EGADFQGDGLGYASAEGTPLFFVLAAVAGLAAIAYNRALLETIAAAERLGRLSVELRAGLIGAAVETLAWFAPSVVGGGDAITQRSLVGAETLSVLPVGLSTPLRTRHGIIRRPNTGGAVRAHARAWRAARLVPRTSLPRGVPYPGDSGRRICRRGDGRLTGVVRAPLTGIVLATEMTANVTMLLPMLVAC